MYKTIDSASIHIKFIEYNANQSFCISYKSLDKEQLIKQFEKDEIIYLSDYKDGEELKYSFARIIYNNTNTNIMVNTKDEAFGVEKTEKTIIPKGEIYGFDWMIESAFITIEKTNSATQNNSNNKTPVNNDKELPQAGIDITLENVLKISVIISGIVVVILSLKCLQNRKCKNEK